MSEHMRIANTDPPVASQRILHTVCCSVCGRVLSKSFSGTASYVKCEKCKAELYYTVDDNGPSIQITKGPKHPTHSPSIRV